jgi:hypothetical protein
VLLTVHPRFGLRRSHRRESSLPPPQAVKPTTASTRHTRLIARHEPLRPKPPGLARQEHENRFGLHRSPPHDSPEDASHGDRTPRRTHAAGTLAAGTRGSSDAIDVEDPALLAVTRGLNRKLRQDASPLNQQTTDARRHPKNFDESPDAFHPRAFRHWGFVCQGGLYAVDTATAQQALLHHSWWLTKSTPREGHLERFPALRWLRREVRACVPPESDSDRSLAMVSRPESQDSVLTPKEA